MFVRRAAVCLIIKLLDNKRCSPSEAICCIKDVLLDEDSEVCSYGLDLVSQCFQWVAVDINIPSNHYNANTDLIGSSAYDAKVSHYHLMSYSSDPEPNSSSTESSKKSSSDHYITKSNAALIVTCDSVRQNKFDDTPKLKSNTLELTNVTAAKMSVDSNLSYLHIIRSCWLCLLESFDDLPSHLLNRAASLALTAKQFDFYLHKLNKGHCVSFKHYNRNEPEAVFHLEESSYKNDSNVLLHLNNDNCENEIHKYDFDCEQECVKENNKLKVMTRLAVQKVDENTVKISNEKYTLETVLSDIVLALQARQSNHSDDEGFIMDCY